MLTVKACKKAYMPSAIENIFSLNLFVLKYILYIYYSLDFKKNQANNQALLDINSKINATTVAYMVSISLKVRSISVRA